MVETRTRILGIAPYEGMHTAMMNAAQAYPNVQLDVYTGCPPTPTTASSPGAAPPP